MGAQVSGAVATFALPLLCKHLLLGPEPVLLVLLGSKPVLLVLARFTITAFMQLIVSIVLDHGRPVWVLWSKRGCASDGLT
jgi:hypothetical protein